MSETDIERLHKLQRLAAVNGGNYLVQKIETADLVWLCDQVEEAQADVGQHEAAFEAAYQQMLNRTAELKTWHDLAKQLEVDLGSTRPELAEYHARAGTYAAEAETAEVLCGEALVALRATRKAIINWSNDEYGCPDEFPSALGRIDKVLATDAAKAALARRESEQAVIEAAKIWHETSEALAVASDEGPALAHFLGSVEERLHSALDALAAEGQE